jgi:hypothetical protein
MNIRVNHIFITVDLRMTLKYFNTEDKLFTTEVEHILIACSPEGQG